MSGHTGGLGAGQAPDAYDDYLRNKYSSTPGSDQVSDPHAQSTPAFSTAFPKIQMPAMPQMPTYTSPRFGQFGSGFGSSSANADPGSNASGGIGTGGFGSSFAHDSPSNVPSSTYHDTSPGQSDLSGYGLASKPAAGEPLTSPPGSTAFSNPQRAPRHAPDLSGYGLGQTSQHSVNSHDAPASPGTVQPNLSSAATSADPAASDSFGDPAAGGNYEGGRQHANSPEYGRDLQEAEVGPAASNYAEEPKYSSSLSPTTSNVASFDATDSAYAQGAGDTNAPDVRHHHTESHHHESSEQELHYSSPGVPSASEGGSILTPSTQPRDSPRSAHKPTEALGHGGSGQAGIGAPATESTSPADAAVGGKAASLAPEVAAVASNTASHAGLKETTPTGIRDAPLPGQANTADSTSSASHGSKPTHLQGKADSASLDPSAVRGGDEQPEHERDLKGFGSDISKGPEQGYSPRPGYPKDAGAEGGAVGAKAASIAPQAAAAAASGHPGGSHEQGITPGASSAETGHGTSPGPGVVESALAAGSAALAAVGDQVQHLVGKPDTRAAAEEASFSPQQGSSKTAPSQTALTGGGVGSTSPDASTKHAPNEQGGLVQSPGLDTTTTAGRQPTISTGGIVESTIAAGSAAATAVGNKVADLMDSMSGAKEGDKVEGLSPPIGQPRDAPAHEAAVGGEAGNIAPVAAAVASGVPESQAQAKSSQGTPKVADKGLLAKAADTISDTVGDLTSKYAPTALGGAPAEDSARDVAGLHPKPGHPSNAPAEEAAIGGTAASISPLAAAVASGQSEGAVMRKPGLHRAQEAQRGPGSEAFAATQPSYEGIDYGMQRHSGGPALPADAAKQMEPVRSPIVVLGVIIVLISLFVRVPMWMWAGVLGLAGALYVVNFLGSQGPHRD